MRTALGIDKSIDILDHIEALPTDRQPEAEEAIRSIEREGMVSLTYGRVAALRQITLRLNWTLWHLRLQSQDTNGGPAWPCTTNGVSSS